MNHILSTKQFIISHLVLLLLSLTFLGGMYYILNESDFKANLVRDYRPVTTKHLSFNFELSNPEDELLVFEKTVLVSGKTAPRATIIITSDIDTIATSANNLGEFSKVINLSKGLNNLTIVGFDESGNSKQEIRTIFYSEEKI